MKEDRQKDAFGEEDPLEKKSSEVTAEDLRRAFRGAMDNYLKGNPHKADTRAYIFGLLGEHTNKFADVLFEETAHALSRLSRVEKEPSLLGINLWQIYDHVIEAQFQASAKNGFGRLLSFRGTFQPESWVEKAYCQRLGFFWEELSKKTQGAIYLSSIQLPARKGLFCPAPEALVINTPLISQRSFLPFGLSLN